MPYHEGYSRRERDMRHRVTGLAFVSLIASSVAAMVLAATPSLAGAQVATGYIEICKTFTAGAPSFQGTFNYNIKVWRRQYHRDHKGQSGWPTAVHVAHSTASRYGNSHRSQRSLVQGGQHHRKPGRSGNSDRLDGNRYRHDDGNRRGPVEDKYSAVHERSRCRNGRGL